MKNTCSFSALPLLIVAPLALATIGCAQADKAPAANIAEAPAQAATSAAAQGWFEKAGLC